MSNELATAQNFPMSVHTQDDKTWGDVVAAGSFLPYISLYGGNSNACKEGLIGIGRYGLVRQKDKIEDLTAEFSVLAIGWRYKAMKIGEGIISNYNPKSEMFLKIKEESEIKDSGCMYGIEFLFWVPELPARCFATFYCNSKTSRREAQNIRPFCPEAPNPARITPEHPNGYPGHGPKPMTLKSQLIKTEKYTWHGPVATQCSTQFNLPSTEEMIEQATKFANPKESEIEAVKPDDKVRRDR
jgi:hypothetical protein